MSRFNNLEFGEGASEENSAVRAETVKDESFYAQQAQGAFERGNFELALRSYAKVLEYNSKNATAWSGQVRMLIELGDPREARMWADKALTTFPNNPELLAAKAVALARLGELNGALSFSDASMYERDDSPYIWLARGEVLLARKEKQAAFCFEKVLASAPRNWFWSWLTGRVLAYYKQFSKALKVLQEGLNWDPARAVLWFELGRAQLELGLTPGAQHSFEQARQLDAGLEEVRPALRCAGDTTLLQRLGRRLNALFRSS